MKHQQRWFAAVLGLVLAAFSLNAAAGSKTLANQTTANDVDSPTSMATAQQLTAIVTKTEETAASAAWGLGKIDSASLDVTSANERRALSVETAANDAVASAYNPQGAVLEASVMAGSTLTANMAGSTEKKVAPAAPIDYGGVAASTNTGAAST